MFCGSALLPQTRATPRNVVYGRGGIATPLHHPFYRRPSTEASLSSHNEPKRGHAEAVASLERWLWVEDGKVVRPDPFDDGDDPRYGMPRVDEVQCLSTHVQAYAI